MARQKRHLEKSYASYEESDTFKVTQRMGY
jgi:hypothetical protein